MTGALWNMKADMFNSREDCKMKMRTFARTSWAVETGMRTFRIKYWAV